jgi:hypothetical protein
MRDEPPPTPAAKSAPKLPQKSARADRLAEVLRANLKRRKEAQRQRQDGGSPSDGQDL